MASVNMSLVHRQHIKYQRSRGVKARVRSGCVTCKIRHVKCDEEKPVYRCASAGYECDGYCYNTLARRPPSNPHLPPGTNIKNSRVAIPRAQSLSNTHTQLIVQPSAGPRFKTATEHSYFIVFQESAAAQLSGYYESSVWDHVVLQACHEEQWAMHVVVAIGALHRTLEVSPARSDRYRGTADGERDRKSHYIFALQQYGQALMQLSDKTKEDCQSESCVRLALISSLLTTCFETYICNRESAITQAKAGIELLFKWTAKHQKEPADDLTDEWSNVRRVASESIYLHDDLVGAFQRLDYQLLLCRGFQHGRKAPREFPSIHRTFTSLDEACRFWDLVVRRVLHFHAVKDITKQHSLQGYGNATSKMNDAKGKVYPKNVQAERHNFTTASEQFFRSFRPIFEDSRQRRGTNEYLLANLIMVRSLICRFAVSRGPSDSEIYSDAFLQDYMLIVKLAHELIDNAKMTLRRAIFNFDMTLGAGIFYLARHCREPTVRRAAIELLLEHPQQEGWFDTLTAAKISTWIMNEEEEGIVDGFIPDAARLRLVKHETGPQKAIAILYCSKLVWKEGKTAREMLHPVTIML